MTRSSSINRRQALAGVAAVGVGVPALAACGSDDGSATEGSGSSSPEAGTDLTTTGEIDVEGGAVFPDDEVVVTQPTEGDFKGFSAVCTHSGCLVASVSGGTINCDCHGSKFSIEDGSVVAGPASDPLAEVKLTVKGDSITVA